MTFKKRHELVWVIGVWLGGVAANGQSLPNLYPFPNSSGVLETYNAGGGPIDLTGPFFQSLGTDGRSCGSCHKPAQGWGISAAEVKTRFYLTQGLDPIFRTNDGSNCDHNIDTSTLGGRQKAYSLLINKGLIRVQVQVPATTEFSVVSVANPYGCSDAATLSVYRRPLPSTNLRFLSTLMWDGRESFAQHGTQKITFGTTPGDLQANLAHQSVDATNIHAQASTPLTPQQQQDIVNFEMALSTAQAYDYGDRKSTRLNSRHFANSYLPSVPPRRPSDPKHPRPSVHSANAATAAGHRQFRDGPLNGAGVRLWGRRIERPWSERRTSQSGNANHAGVLRRHQRLSGRQPARHPVYTCDLRSV